MRSFRLAIGLCIVAGALGCAEADPWVGEWHVVVDVEAEVAEWGENQESMRKKFEERASSMTEEGRIELKATFVSFGMVEELADVEQEAKKYAAELRAVGEDEGTFLIFERGKDGALVAVYEERRGEDPADFFRVLSADAMGSSELIRCRFRLYEGSEAATTSTYELRLTGENSAEGSSSVFGKTEPVKLERVR